MTTMDEDPVERLRQAALAQLMCLTADRATKNAALEAVRLAARAVSPDDPAAQIAALVEAQDWAAARQTQIAREQATVHIRKKAGRNLGNNFYSHAHRTRFIEGYVDPQGQTLCGAPATQFDQSWADTRFPKSLAYVECASCIELRTTTAN